MTAEFDEEREITPPEDEDQVPPLLRLGKRCRQ